MEEGYGNGAEIGGDRVKLVHKREGHTGGGGGVVQIPGAPPVPGRLWLSRDTPEHKEGTEIMGVTGKYDMKRRDG